jgi:hypothetical protein
MPDDHNPSDWYWLVAGDNTKFYSSKVGNYVLPSNTDYIAWLGRGNLPTRILSEAELGEVLAPLSIRPVHAGVLDAYKDKQATDITIKVAAKVLFNHENRIRALEGKNLVTPAQMKTAVKDLM